MPMAELRKILSGLGLANVRTYIQSGNAVFSAPADKVDGLDRRIARALSQGRDFSPAVQVLTAAQLEAAAAANPYSVSDPKTLHLAFLAKPPGSFNSERLHAIKASNEDFMLIGSVFYLNAPDGIGRSKLAASVERLLEVSATGRNWRTVSKLLAMAEDARKLS